MARQFAVGLRAASSIYRRAVRVRAREPTGDHAKADKDQSSAAIVGRHDGQSTTQAVLVDSRRTGKVTPHARAR